MRKSFTFKAEVNVAEIRIFISEITFNDADRYFIIYPDLADPLQCVHLLEKGNQFRPLFQLKTSADILIDELSLFRSSNSQSDRSLQPQKKALFWTFPTPCN